jgi:SAM-dependent methyltransferase
MSAMGEEHTAAAPGPVADGTGPGRPVHGHGPGHGQSPAAGYGTGPGGTGHGSGPGHGLGGQGGEEARPVSDAEYWDSRYRERHHIWSGRPNAALLRHTEGLVPGRALDLGCGEGADAIWLAGQGWHVVASDISQVALGRAREHARESGVADLVEFQRHDFAESFPSGAYDLVSAHFLHAPHDMPRDRILRDAAAAVAPGGILLIVGHAGVPPWAPASIRENPPELPTPREVYDGLALPADAWEVLVAEEYDEPVTDPEGRPAVRRDNTLKVRRRPA